MDIEVHGKTVDDLPNELLTMIFRQIKFWGRLRISLVCQRWLEVIASDIAFMRTINFNVDRWNFEQETGYTKLMRPYYVVTFSNYKDFDDMPQLEIDLLEHVETLLFDETCDSLNTESLDSFLGHCKRLKEVKFSKCVFGRRSNNKYMAPVKLTVVTPFCESPKCFNSISQLNVSSFDWFEMNSDAVTRFLRAHGPVIPQMKIHNHYFLQLLNNTKHLKLKLKALHMSLDSVYSVAALEPLFVSQQAFVTEFSAKSLTTELFDLMRERLINLTSVNIPANFLSHSRLNDLSVLAHLQSLTVHLRNREPYELDVCQLALTNLEVNGAYRSEMTIRCSVNGAMHTLRKLQFRNFLIDEELLSQCVNLMPNLRVLNLPSCSDKGPVSDKVTAINKLCHLQSITFNACLVNNVFLSCLNLPQLHYVKLIEFGKPVKIERAALDALADNCPHLLRILAEKNNSKVRILFRRSNGTEKFRRVRHPQNMVGQQLDYDSVESCSDEEDLTL